MKILSSSKIWAFLFCFIAGAITVDATKVIVSNWDEVTKGKTMFLKFYSPGCGHCKAIKADWEKLMSDFEDSKSHLIGEIDCTSMASEQLCDQYAIEFYPTIKYGDSSNLRTYSGARNYEAFKAFVDENLVALCDPNNLANCDDESKANVVKYMEMGYFILEDLILDKEEDIKELEEDYVAEIKDLQEQAQDALEFKEETIKTIKTEDGPLSLMRKVLATMEKPEGPRPEEEEETDNEEDDDDDEEEQQKGDEL